MQVDSCYSLVQPHLNSHAHLWELHSVTRQVHFWPGIMNVMMGAVAQYGMAYLPQQFPVPPQARDAIV